MSLSLKTMMINSRKFDSWITAERWLTNHAFSLADLIELRKLRKARQGIDVDRLNKGDVKKKRRRPTEDEEKDQGGLKAGASKETVDDEEWVCIAFMLLW